MSNFEERLLVELRSLVAAQPVDDGQPRPLWRGPRLVLAGGACGGLVVAAGAGVFFLSAGTQAAYAVTKNADGTVTVEIDSLTDAAGLQAKLAGGGCERRRRVPAGGEDVQAAVVHAGRPRARARCSRARSGARATARPASRSAGTSLPTTRWWSPRRPAPAERALGIAWAKGDVPPCQVVDAPAGSGPLGGPPVGADAQYRAGLSQA